jgi:hypothetical protein
MQQGLMQLAACRARLAQGAMAVLGLGLGTTEPHFTVVAGGEPLVTLSSHNAVFHALLLLLQCARLAQASSIGGCSLEYLRLAAVLRPATWTHSLFSSWFGMWV